MTDHDDKQGMPIIESELRTSREIGKLAKALARAQAKIQNPPKNREVTVHGRNKHGGPVTYEFEYATIDEVLNAARPALSAHGLSFVQVPTETSRGPVLFTRLMHKSGQWIESSISIGPFEDMQGFGATVTYLKRYALCAMCGIAAEDDQDVGDVADVAERMVGPLTKAVLREIRAGAPARPTRRDYKDSAERATHIADQEGVSPDEALSRARAEE
ncbi:MAG TPA: hypothetical protein ENH55_13415 [Aurantimonas coralicida]|uniref:ERF family protein n=2 Tax=root TaxID=1 RepID=A0A9C9TGD8_9HYPH|nr:hypothetical protein [Aurantimonas coralicida]HET99640.1 hypothetical protein [Aurantimonas coralicida]